MNNTHITRGRYHKKTTHDKKKIKKSPTLTELEIDMSISGYHHNVKVNLNIN